jgi:hypothetical protein
MPINYQSMHPKQNLSFLNQKIYKSQHQEIIVKINNDIVEQVSCVKFLGVLIDQELTWKNMIKYAGLIAKLRHFTNKNTSKLIYYALVYPYLKYGNLVLGNTYPTRLQKSLKVQKKIVRLFCFKSYMDHSEPIFLQLKILDIYKINDYLCSLFMYRFNYSQKFAGL